MTNEILEEIADCIEAADIKGFTKSVKELLISTDKEGACKELSAILFRRYTTYNADSTAKWMEIILKIDSELGILKFPENYFFRLAIIKGSPELYQCYIEEVIEPYLRNKDEEFVFDSYSDLYALADKLTDTLFPKYERSVKGSDFNGAFAMHELIPNSVIINNDDYEYMDSVIERYNTIVGRRDIVKHLMERV